MSNPDTTTGSNLLMISILGGLVVVITIFLFNYQHKSYFVYLLYGGLPVLIYFFSVLMNIIVQSSTSINVLNALKGGLATLGTTYLALLVSYISYFRIPIASVFTPLFVDTNVNIVTAPTRKPTVTPMQGGSFLHRFLSRAVHQSKKQTGGACCSPSISLEEVEDNYPTIKGISYGFYLFFAICFGGVFGTSIAQ